MASRRGMTFLKGLLSLLLVAAFLGVAVRECPSCAEKCCPPDASLTLNFDQAPVAAPDAAPAAPAASFVFVAVAAPGVPSLRIPEAVPAPSAFRPDPGRTFALSRAQLHSWTL